MLDISAFSARFGVNAERGEGGNFPVFLRRVAGKHVLVLTDLTTRPFADPILEALAKNGNPVSVCTLPAAEPVADEAAVRLAAEAAKGAEYLLAVGSGTLNDIAKRTGYLAGKPCGVYATAPSMDGFTSGVAPLIENNFKITRPARVVSDVLMDFSVLSAAPRIMLGAGAGDVFAKYCCLADWKISSLLTGENYNAEAASVMREAVSACEASLPALIGGKQEGVEKLMEALLISGYAMVIAGSSRPASGAEHHMSHYLEMDFLRRGKRIPLHGVKVALGTLVSLYLYHTLGRRAAFTGAEAVLREADFLPSVGETEKTLRALGCPTRFSELDIPRDTVRNMLFEAYKIRDRYTILTLYCTRGLMKGAADEILGRFY